MADSVFPTASGCEPISQAIAQLRQLNQLDVQDQWHLCLADLPSSEATQLKQWQNWERVSLNARHHIAWAKGKAVLWLGQRLTIPPQLQGYPLTGMRLQLALTWWAEDCQIFVNGQLVQAGDLFDCSARILLTPAAKPGQTIEVAIRLVSPGHDDGALVRSLCMYERADQTVNPCPEPGFVADELAVLQTYLTHLAPEKLELLATAVAQIDWSSLPDCARFDTSLKTLRQQLQPLRPWIKQRCIRLLGHAHLDMAWLWQVDETWKAAERTFTSVLQLQKEFPELIFCHSTPALYAWLEENQPVLFHAIQAQVATGRWEIVAGLWVEPELNLVNGESIARQVLYGQRYVQQRFGQQSAIAWLPDCFGFCWQLPQILRQGGVKYFVTQKLRWNDTTQFPHEIFQWQAPDGTSILSLHSAPIGEGIDPVKMADYASRWEQKTGLSSALWLPGVGDHGGGPTRDMLEIARRWQQSPFFPQLEFGTAETFLAAIEQDSSPQSNPQRSAPAAASTKTALPVWNDELYLEFHRGCYTTHADQKRFNRRAEEALYQAELLASLATLSVGVYYPQATLEKIWKKALFNQFHDILPGSAIAPVFTEANQAWQEVHQVCNQLIDQSLQTIATRISLPPVPHPEAQAVLVFNPLNWDRSQIVTLSVPPPSAKWRVWEVYDLDGERIESQWLQPTDSGQWQLCFLADWIPGIGYRCFWLCPTATTAPQAVPPQSPCLLENEFLRAIVDPATGELTSLFDKMNQRQILNDFGNQLQAFEDGGQYWDAWNIDPDYGQHPLPSPEQVEIRREDWGDVAARLRVIRRLGKSTFDQTYVLEKNSPMLKIESAVDWQDRHVLVKAAFSFNLEVDQVAYEVPYGTIERPTQPESDRQKAMWEVPALRWADWSDQTFGCSLLNDSKYGYDASPHQLRMTLLRGSEWPNPEADRGKHVFTYALYPHAGNWQAARTVHRGYELNQPCLSLVFAPDTVQGSVVRKTLPATALLINLAADNLVLTAFKPSEDHPDRWVLRCYEAHGQTTPLPWADHSGLVFSSFLDPALVEKADLLEQPLQTDSQADDATHIDRLTPWQIATFVFPTLS